MSNARVTLLSLRHVQTASHTIRAQLSPRYRVQASHRGVVPAPLQARKQASKHTGRPHGQTLNALQRIPTGRRHAPRSATKRPPSPPRGGHSGLSPLQPPQAAAASERIFRFPTRGRRAASTGTHRQCARNRPDFPPNSPKSGAFGGFGCVHPAALPLRRRLATASPRRRLGASGGGEYALLHTISKYECHHIFWQQLVSRLRRMPSRALAPPLASEPSWMVRRTSSYICKDHIPCCVICPYVCKLLLTLLYTFYMKNVLVRMVVSLDGLAGCAPADRRRPMEPM